MLCAKKNISINMIIIALVFNIVTFSVMVPLKFTQVHLYPILNINFTNAICIDRSLNEM